MKALVRRFANLEAEIARKKGDFSFFALVLREGAPDRWDLLVAAPWSAPNDPKTLEYLVEEIKLYLGPQELINLSRIVVLDPNNPRLLAFNDAFRVEHGIEEVRESELFGIPIQEAYVITSKRPQAAVAP